jgi:serine/threonine-protein kinase
MRLDSVPAVLDALRRSRLLSPAQMNEVKSALIPQTDDPATLGALLVESGLLTEFQTEHILSGSNEPLILGEYRLLDLLGEGGLCKVYKALHTRHREFVALKIVHPELRSNVQVLDQFHGEMEMIAQLEHPRFPKALDIQLEGDHHFFVMEFVEGIDLMRLVQKVRALPPRQACDYIHQAALGLQYAFEQGLVHRDVKPANLLVTFDTEQIYVLDIGLARLEWSYRDAGSTFTPATQGVALMGTPDYVAPEQALNPDSADIRSDIYSLGCTLYHLLVGEPPFPGGSLSRKLLHHQTAPPPSVRTKKPDLPQELATIVQKMMAKDPAERYKTPAGVAVALSPFTHIGVRIDLSSLRPRPVTGEPSQDAASSGSPPAAPGTPSPMPAQQPGPAYGTPDGPPERRAHPRRAGNPTSVLMADHPNAAEPLRAWVINRCQGGLGLLVEEALEIGTDVYVRPTDEIYVNLWVPVRVIYCFQERVRWRIGCQFLQPISWNDLRAFG